MSLRRVVVVSSQDQVQELARKIAQEVFVADDLPEAVDITQTVNPDLLVFDNRFSPDHIRQFLDTTDKNQIYVPVIVVGDGKDRPGLSEEFIRIGACDYIHGKQDYSRLEKIVSRINDESRSNDPETSSADFFAEDYAASVRIVGRSKAIRDKLKMIKLVAASCCNPVLIVGETGTGKELAAKAIHLLRHPNEQFIAVNCAALTANLLESELFGHAKGSFTGADREKTGLLELAGFGTILLDEISEMPMDLQAKLLRVLQEKNFRKVGGTNTIPCNATIIASSNRNLQNQIRAKRFRRDLYYRLNICPITIAPLRAPERREDIKLLAEYFLKTSTICPEKAGRITSLTKLALEALQKHDWPGNVRELSNVIERAIMLETTDKIGLSSIMIDPLPYDESSDGPTADHVTNFSLEKAERELIARALRETGWQKTRAAALLGITRATLYAKVKQYNIGKDSLVTAYCGKQAPGEISTTYHPEPVAVP
ncbi:MAG: sigma-54-dependent Fis family transcriptional regulator [Planctomycetota bacterium]|nr:MAG: sigma-54-dependent Fis family transcriptional regulator [Planctomycetota bacterium]